jgi:Mce-associated membrane protein
VTAVLTASSPVDEVPPPETDAAASWRARAGAFALDVLVPAGVLATLVLVTLTTPQQSWLWWVCVVVAALVLLGGLANRWLLPATTGWSLGRALFGIAIVRRSGDAVGPWRLLARDAAHLLDTLALFIGWLWPLWDSRTRTFADYVTRTEVRRMAPKPLGARRMAICAVSALAAIAVVAAGLSYLTVYRTELRLAHTREQLAVQGPKLVTDMLSYSAKTLQADFDHAKSIVSDSYRPALEQQQQSILAAAQKAPVVDNTYWATNGSVLKWTDDRGTMLIFLQGQRGDPPNFRTITATVTAEFERAGDGQWKVTNLTVLAKPQPSGGGG